MSPEAAEVLEQKFGKPERHPFSPAVFTALEANIRRYGWQSLVVRLTAIVLGSVFILYSAFYIMRVSPASFRLWPVICLFLMWMIDGHCKSMQAKYVDLYHQTLASPQTDMVCQVDRKFNVASLWQPMVMVPYVILIGLLALANLGI